MSELRTWLRKQPRPERLRVRTADDEERTIALTEDVRNRWKAAEEAVLASGAVVVECLAADGSILRARELERPDEEREPAHDQRTAAIALARDRRELGDVLRGYGEQLNAAFDRGAAAANTGQENLVALVEVLTTHLSYAITNLHNVSVNLANIIQRTDDDAAPPAKEKLLENVLSLALARGAGSPPSPPAAPANGGKGA